MSAKRYGIAGLFLIIVAGLWWRLSTPADVAVTAAQPAPSASPAARDANPAAPAASPAAGTAAASAAPASISGPIRLWGAVRSEEGSSLEPKEIAKAHQAGAVAVGRVTVYDGGALSLGQLEAKQTIVLPLPGGVEARGIINLVRTEPDGTVQVGGGLVDDTGGRFSLVQNNGRLGGRVLLQSTQQAFLVSTLATGEVMIKEVALGDVLCQPFPRLEPEAGAIAVAGPVAAPPELRSRPGATAVLYLDFDGAVVTDPDWNSGNTITAAASSLNATQITEVFTRVKEDFWPFAINVTTVESDYTSAPVGRRMRVIITPTSTASPGAGGVAYVDSFATAGSDFSSDVPCWVFNSSVNAVVETISHELGHTLGLHHDGRTSPVEEYYAGHGSGLSWGPIMGSAFNVLTTQWSKGEYPNASNLEDDLAILSGQQPTPLSVAHGPPVSNNTGYVVDDIGSSREGAVPLDVSSYVLNATGVINTSTDSDFFTFTVGAPRKLTFTVTPSNTYSRHANLDAQLELQNAAGTALATVNPENSLNASLDTTVAAGTYYLRISGAGHAANGSDPGYSNYGSLGPYTLAGTLGDVVAPSITSNPQGNSLYASQNVSFSATAIGTAPLVYQWRKNGDPVSNDSRISGATSPNLTINNLALSDAGTYTLLVSNGAGSITTAGAALAVTMPSLPTFNYPPSSTTVVEGNYLSLYAYASSQVNVTYQWYRNGILLTGQTSSSLSISPVKPTDAGNYTLVATNVAGSATSGTAVVTVTSASLPSITSQPQGGELFTGQYFSLYVNATSTGPLTFQWYRNGTLIPGATSSGHYISNASAASHAGSYTVVVTSPAGSVTSVPAEISVSSSLPPRITSQPYSYNYASAGSSASFSVSAEGVGPLTYRWYRNGVQVPSASSSYLYINSVTASDVGEYYATVSNPNGTVQSNTVTLDFSPNYTADTYWYETREVDGVIYFLFKNSAKIARYDLATETWLPAWNLIYAPTAFTVSPDAVYVAFGTTIKKYSRSLGNETVFATTANGVNWLEAAGNVLITASLPSYAYTALTTYNVSTGAQIDTETFVYSATQGFSYQAGRVYGRTSAISPGDLHSIVVNSDGTIGADTETPYHGDYPEGTRTFLLKNGTLVADNGGVVYDATTLAFRASFGTTLKDAAQAGTGYCVLTGTRLYRYDENFRQIGSALIPVYGARLWVRGSTLYTFVQPTTPGSQPTVHKTDISLLVPEPPAPVANPYARKITADQVVMGEDGVVYIYNKELRNIFRWSTASRQYLPAIPLVARPRFLAYSAANRALYFDNGNTLIKRIGVDGNLSEESFYNTPQQLMGLQTAGDKIMTVDPSGAWVTHYVLSDSGTLLDSEDWNYYSREYTWSPANSRLYFFRDDSSPNDLHYETISAAGLITEEGETPYHGEVTATLPIRVSPDGSRILLGSGQIYDGATMNRLGVLGAHTDSAWSNNRWHTIQPAAAGTRLQAWAPSDFSPGATLDLPGSPVRTFALSGDRLLVITSLQGYLQFWEISSTTFGVNSRVNTAAMPVRNYTDFNGDGQPDILWRNMNSGEVGAWLMNGTTKSSYVALGSVGLEYALAGTGDFNGDGKADILWRQRETGQVGTWLMNGTTVLSYAVIGTVGLELKVAGTGDFNGDGKTDILWRNTSTGAVGAWLMNGTVVSSYAAIGSAGAELTPAGTGDFDGDGKVDILWHNRSSGVVSAWLLNGTSIASTVTLGTVGADVVAAGTGDYNGDGRTDILWRHVSLGDVSVWLMNGTTLSSSAAIAPAGAELTLSGFGEPTRIRRTNVDFNADGKADILWRNNQTGEVGTWLMNGTTMSSYVTLGAVGMSWSVTGLGDMDGNGQADILWRNTASGEVGAWLMNGTTVAGYASLGAVGLEMMIAGTGDFNADGKTDILWRNRINGDLGAWLMNGTTVSSYLPLGSAGTELAIAGTGDFNLDGQTDILWRNRNTGAVSVWLMNGTVGTAANIGPAAAELTLVGTGDYNFDGRTDILWRNLETGAVSAWLLNGTTVSSTVAIGSSGLHMSLVGSGEPFRAGRAGIDFNADGQTDILWRNDETGEVGTWLMNGTTVSAYVSLGYANPTWTIAGTGDIDEDRQADILWRNPANEVGVWYMRGSGIESYASLGNVGPGWTIAGAADFDGDGETDLLWRNNETGDVGTWLINKTSTRYVAIGSVGTTWTIAGTGDYTGDGKPDILWRELATGNIGIWRMDRTAVLGYTAIGTATPTWRIVGTGDYTGDGKPDILWRDMVTGEVGLWRMNGTTPAGYIFIGAVGLSWSIHN